jgi:predicted enzyme related to lactoylglutathione lyase
MGYWLVNPGTDGTPGINGGLLKKNAPVTATTNTIEVESVDTAAETVKRAGGKLVTPKTSIPGVGYFACCEDTEGNLFGVKHNHKTAK